MFMKMSLDRMLIKFFIIWFLYFRGCLWVWAFTGNGSLKYDFCVFVFFYFLPIYSSEILKTIKEITFFILVGISFLLFIHKLDGIGGNLYNKIFIWIFDFGDENVFNDFRIEVLVSFNRIDQVTVFFGWYIQIKLKHILKFNQ